MSNRLLGSTAQLRDWLIPCSIFAGIAASVVLYVVSLPSPGRLLLTASGFSFASMLAFVWALYWSFTRLESMEIERRG